MNKVKKVDMNKNIINSKKNLFLNKNNNIINIKKDFFEYFN